MFGQCKYLAFCCSGSNVSLPHPRPCLHYTHSSPLRSFFHFSPTLPLGAPSPAAHDYIYPTSSLTLIVCQEFASLSSYDDMLAELPRCSCGRAISHPTPDPVTHTHNHTHSHTHAHAHSAQHSSHVLETFIGNPLL